MLVVPKDQPAQMHPWSEIGETNTSVVILKDLAFCIVMSETGRVLVEATSTGQADNLPIGTIEMGKTQGEVHRPKTGSRHHQQVLLALADLRNGMGMEITEVEGEEAFRLIEGMTRDEGSKHLEAPTFATIFNSKP